MIITVFIILASIILLLIAGVVWGQVNDSSSFVAALLLTALGAFGVLALVYR